MWSLYGVYNWSWSSKTSVFSLRLFEWKFGCEAFLPFVEYVEWTADNAVHRRSVHFVSLSSLKISELVCS